IIKEHQAMNAERYNYITLTATQASECKTNIELAQFHYFNPNGLRAQKRANDEIISQAVEQERCKGGAILAYGSMDAHYTDLLQGLAIERRRLARVELAVVL